ncbi:hypothetical protein DO64_5979 [Burkholderia pseudomallei]|nr:hypothetical protein DO64_5979 [Burkholderia pseudomallei]
MFFASEKTSDPARLIRRCGPFSCITAIIRIREAVTVRGHQGMIPPDDGSLSPTMSSRPGCF